MTLNQEAKVSLVGAGPGDPDLLTIKGLKAIQSAKVVLYDALVSKSMLDLIPKSAHKLYVGKRANKHAYSQDEINLLLVQYAFTHGHVVRLKGGDPFVFGRGHEEKVFVEAFGISVDVVPGISSCISVPELQGVPLTRRGLNESFWVLTATTRSGNLSKDISLAAQSSATAVILMGIRKLEQIAKLFIENGKADTLAMVVSRGSMPGERAIVAKVKDINALAYEEKIASPGIIVIGDVVGLHPSQVLDLVENQNKKLSHGASSK